MNWKRIAIARYWNWLTVPWTTSNLTHCYHWRNWRGCSSARTRCLTVIWSTSFFWWNILNFRYLLRYLLYWCLKGRRIESFSRLSFRCYYCCWIDWEENETDEFVYCRSWIYRTYSLGHRRAISSTSFRYRTWRNLTYRETLFRAWKPALFRGYPCCAIWTWVTAGSLKSTMALSLSFRVRIPINRIFIIGKRFLMNKTANNESNTGDWWKQQL